LRRTSITDETGVFTLTQLPAGRYQLDAQADTFNPVAVLPLVTLLDGGRADDLRVLMRALGASCVIDDSASADTEVVLSRKAGGAS